MLSKVKARLCKPQAVLFLVVLTSVSCTSMGPSKLISSHTSYNDAVQLSVTREVLANLVRSRYSDPMQFLAVSAINAQFSVSVGASAGAGGLGRAGSTGQAGANVGYSDSPTITYVPQSDAGFYKSFYSPFDVGETVGFWQSYRYAQTQPELQTLSLGFSFASVNGEDDFVGGRLNEGYRKRLDAIVRLFQLGASYRLVPEWDFDTLAIPTASVTAEDKVDAFRAGLYFVEEEGGDSVRLARYRLVLALVLPHVGGPEVDREIEALGATPGGSRYIFRPPTHSSPGWTDPHAIWVTPRSMADMLNLATRFVEVPAAHAGIVPSLEPIHRDPAVAAPRVHSSAEEPAFPYRIEHRGYWFYVDDTEIESKMFLEALVAAYSSRVGSKQATDSQPQIVIGVGGG